MNVEVSCPVNGSGRTSPGSLTSTPETGSSATMYIAINDPNDEPLSGYTALSSNGIGVVIDVYPSSITNSGQQAMGLGVGSTCTVTPPGGGSGFNGTGSITNIDVGSSHFWVTDTSNGQPITGAEQAPPSGTGHRVTWSELR